MRHTTVFIISERYQQSLLLFTGVSVNLKKIPRSARPKFQGFSYPTSSAENPPPLADVLSGDMQCDFYEDREVLHPEAK